LRAKRIRAQVTLDQMEINMRTSTYRELIGLEELTNLEVDSVAGGSSITFRITSAQAIDGSAGSGGFSQANSGTSTGVNGTSTNGGVSFAASSPALGGGTDTVFVVGS